MEDPESWLLLIYTVPSKPTRKRALIWREIKRVGAVYLRDGVCALPTAEITLRMAKEIATKVQELDGEATVVEACNLPLDRSAAIRGVMLEARRREYADLVRETTLLTRHVQREREHRIVSPKEVEADVAKLSRWLDQIRARDYFAAPEAKAAGQLLHGCKVELGLAPTDGNEDARA